MFQTDEARRTAVRRRDKAADGLFLYSVATTGVFCHPSCASRAAADRNLAFHCTAADAERAGFRPCLRCRPDLPPPARREAALVEAACRRMDAADTPPSLAELASAAGCSPHHFHRVFRRVAGITPKAYAAARRQGRMQAELAAGVPVTAAIYGSGFNSPGRFYAAAGAALGMAPRRARAGGAGETIRHAFGRGDLGLVLVAATERGICAILLGDEKAALLADLERRFPRATLAEAEPDFAATVGRVVSLVARPSASPDLPLDIVGTVFQRQVWSLLQAIPAGETATYAGLAARMGRPGAARAVAGACAANKLAVAIPCHRVIAGTGELSGYRWGLERKRALLRRERQEE